MADRLCPVRIEATGPLSYKHKELKSVPDRIVGVIEGFSQ